MILGEKSVTPRAPLNLLGLACAIGVSTIYFNQPLLVDMGRTYGVSAGKVMFVSGATQVGYALGLLLFVPLGDVLERRKLMMRMYTAVIVALLLVSVAPTLVVDLPLEQRLWQYEMFLPITTIAAVKNLDEAMQLANSVSYGLTAGFYGAPDEVDWFFDRTEAGVNYANRPQGATTGAWPGFQPFGGWKGSGSSGKNAGGVHYLQLYMHEQIHNRVRKG